MLIIIYCHNILVCSENYIGCFTISEEPIRQTINKDVVYYSCKPLSVLDKRKYRDFQICFFLQIVKWECNHLYNIATDKLWFDVKYKFKRPVFIPSMYRLQNDKLLLNQSFKKLCSCVKGHYLPNRKFLLPIKTIRYD